MKKYFPTILTSLVLIFGVGILVAHAQSYTPLAPLPGTVDAATGKTDITTYLAGALKLIIALGGALAIFMAILAGTKYVAMGISPDAKSTAKSDMTNAFIGLALILSSYLILNSINPNLVALNFSLSNVSMPVADTTPQNTSGAPWGDDTSTRNALKNASDIDINKDNCGRVGDSNCTSVYGTSLTVDNGLKSLAQGCRDYSGTGSCKIVVTGGTEYWLHGNRSPDISSNTTAHKPGGNVVDLSKITNSSRLNTFIMKGGPAPSQTGCATGVHYQVGSAIYVDEQITGNDPHWHVCY